MIVGVIRPCRTLIEPDIMLGAAFACHIVQKPASGICATERFRQQRNGPEPDFGEVNRLSKSIEVIRRPPSHNFRFARDSPATDSSSTRESCILGIVIELRIDCGAWVTLFPGNCSTYGFVDIH